MIARRGDRSVAAGLGLALAIAPGLALAGPPANTEPTNEQPMLSISSPVMTPERAKEHRATIKRSVAAARESGDLRTVAAGLERGAHELGDPVGFLNAAKARLELAERDRDPEEAGRAIEDLRRALDILRFLESVDRGETRSVWRPIAPAEAKIWVIRCNKVQARADALIADIERERARPKAPPALLSTRGPSSRDTETTPAPVARAAQPGDDRAPRARNKLVVAGSVSTAFGAAGVGLGLAGLAISQARQRDVDALPEPLDEQRVAELDARGDRGNTMAYVGFTVAALGVGIGVPLIVAGVLRAKKSRASRLRVASSFDHRGGGLGLGGRF